MVYASRLLRRRFRVHNVTLRNCSQFSSEMDAAIIEDVVVEGWRNTGRNGDFFAWSCVFRHVTLRGRIGYIKFSDGPAAAEFLEKRDWSAANRIYYTGVDWSLDISEARFTSPPELHFIPGSLIRRDPETQILVTREQATTALNAGLEWGNSTTQLALRSFVEDGPYDDVVVVAPRASKSLPEYLAAFQMLRQQGLAK